MISLNLFCFMKNYSFLLFFLSISCLSQSKNYFVYHSLINKAEELFFVQNKLDSSLYYYEKVFSDYDFIFVKDLVNASQIAFYSKKPYKKYIKQAFEQGLKIDYLSEIPLFKNEYKKLILDKVLNDLFLENRKKYLAKIDIEYRDFTYDLGINDQKHKHLKGGAYDVKKHESIIKLNKKIEIKGFPGDKIVGIADATIFKELKSKYKDFYERFKNDKLLKSYFTSNDEALSEQLIMCVLIHEFSSFSNSYLNSIWLKEIKKGNIHPRDVALLHDNTYRSDYASLTKIKGYYLNNIFAPYIKKNINRKEINNMRKNLHIVSLEVDEKKKEFEVFHGFKLFTGFFNGR